jgi:AbrB family looped-hinge helix DNA binding protein
MPFSMPYGKLNGMELHLDKSGRVVLPKPLRERLGLRAGTTLEATEGADGLLLRPIKVRPSLVERDGLLMHTGQPIRDFDWEGISEDLEQERLKDILGPMR